MAQTDRHPPRLTGLLGEIADAAGDEAALTLARAVGGTQIYIPPRPGPQHWLSALLGHEAACQIADRLTAGVGPLRVDIPLGPCGHQETARATVDRLIGEGRSERDIALATRYTTRGIRKRRAHLRERDSRQPRLL